MRTKEEIIKCLRFRYDDYLQDCKMIGVIKAQEKWLRSIEDLRWVLELNIVEYSISRTRLKEETET